MHTRHDTDAAGQSLLGKLQYRCLLALIFAGGCWLRLYRIAEQVVIDDEWHALNAVQYHGFNWIFTHFGDADHSIPLALLYELQYQLFGLNEWLMRWPMLVAGCISILVLPFLLRHWLNRPERLLFATLLALSPLLIYYSRFARPYSILVVLEPCAILMAWHWWNTRRAVFGLGWVLTACVSAWLNMPALIVVTAPFAWFCLLALQKALKAGDWKPMAGLLAIGAIMLAVLAALLGPPLATQPGALMAKAGQHFINWETLPWAISLASGSGYWWVFAPIALFSILGFTVILGRDRDFGYFLLLTSLVAVLALITTGAAYALHGNVFLRYLIGLVPFYLGFAAVGYFDLVMRISERIPRPSPGAPAVSAISLGLLAVTLLVSGPMRDWPWRSNQFLSHQNYHFHYDWDQNLYRLAMDDWYRAEPFYEEIAGLHDPGETLIVEAPWHMESYSNPLNLQQDLHRQRIQAGFVNGVCAGPLYGELTAGQAGMKFRNFVFLKDILDGARHADYLVLRRRGMPDMARTIEMDFAKCEQAVRARFGDPWRESEDALVFRLSKAESSQH